jgi:hypothetical protein
MPDEYRGRGAVAAYRRYYAGAKARFARAPAAAPGWYVALTAGRTRVGPQ